MAPFSKWKANSSNGPSFIMWPLYSGRSGRPGREELDGSASSYIQCRDCSEHSFDSGNYGVIRDDVVVAAAQACFHSIDLVLTLLVSACSLPDPQLHPEANPGISRVFIVRAHFLQKARCPETTCFKMLSFFLLHQRDLRCAVPPKICAYALWYGRFLLGVLLSFDCE